MKKWCLAIFSWILPASYLAAQVFDEALNKWTSRFPAEKIYIQYDQEYYVPGETIWFKAYLYGDGKPALSSSNLFIQFTNNKGQVINSNQYPLLGAVATGRIDLPDSLPAGDYYMRALTPRMIDLDPALIYKKRIPVLGPGNLEATEAQPQVSLQFFPESGWLVEGIPTTLGFKATDQRGLPVSVNGTIQSEGDTTTTSFRTYHDGMGKLQFLPLPGKKYFAMIMIDGQKKSYTLPAIQRSGINLHVEDEKGGKLFQLTRSEVNKKDFETIFLVVQVNQHVVYENEIGFEDYLSVKGHLLTDSLPSGILHFTVFNKAGLPLAERLAFVDNREYKAPATVEPVKTVMSKRAENSIRLSFPDGIQRSCAITVTDGSIINSLSRENIYSRLILTGDLKGDIYNPAWYFLEKNDSAKQAVDNLLLTQGWSRFNWTKILSKEIPAGNKSDPYLSVSGKVMDEKGKMPYTNGTLKVYLESEDSTTNNYEAVVDQNGAIRMDSLIFFGKAKFFYAYIDRNGKQQPAKLFLDEDKRQSKIEALPVETMISGFAWMSNPTPDAINQRIQYTRTRKQEIIELEKVMLKAKFKKPTDIVNEKYTSGVFRSQSKVTLDNINNPVNDKTINVVDYIRNRIQQVELQASGFVNRKNFSMSTGQKWPVGVFLNEVPTDIASLRSTRVTDVALVKFFEAGFVGVGSGSPGGAIAVYTKERFDGEQKPDKLEHVVYQGYTITREFYQPDYKAKDFKQPATDQRVTLYWNPDVFFDETTTQLEFSFFNNDAGKKYKVIVEGFDASGKLIHVERMIGQD